jgi:carbonic anhydrase
VRNPSPCDVPWGYGPDDGPSRWAQLSACYAECGRGEEQSPTDLTEAVFADLPPLSFEYNRGATLAVVNDGHTIKAKVPPGSVFKIGDNRFALDEFHFHTLSEHRLNGVQQPLELHLVNRGFGGRVAAVGIFIVPDKEDRENPQLAKIWEGLERYTKEPTPVYDVDIMGLLPASYSSSRYAGSLSTPACGQGLEWSVLNTPITASQEQIHRFEKLFAPYGNSRGLQPLHRRPVRKDFH